MLVVGASISLIDMGPLVSEDAFPEIVITKGGISEVDGQVHLTATTPCLGIVYSSSQPVVTEIVQLISEGNSIIFTHLLRKCISSSNAKALGYSPEDDNPSTKSARHNAPTRNPTRKSHFSLAL